MNVTVVCPTAMLGDAGLNTTDPTVPTGETITVLVATRSNVTVNAPEVEPVAPLVGPVSVAVLGFETTESAPLLSKCQRENSPVSLPEYAAAGGVKADVCRAIVQTAHSSTSPGQSNDADAARNELTSNFDALPPDNAITAAAGVVALEEARTPSTNIFRPAAASDTSSRWCHAPLPMAAVLFSATAVPPDP